MPASAREIFPAFQQAIVTPVFSQPEKLTKKKKKPLVI